MKITMNEVIETLAPAIADKLNLRAVMECEDGESMLIDFSSCGDPFLGDEVCIWALQREIKRGEIYCGTEEVDAGVFRNYADTFAFILTYATLHGQKLYVESY